MANFGLGRSISFKIRWLHALRPWLGWEVPLGGCDIGPLGSAKLSTSNPLPVTLLRNVCVLQTETQTLFTGVEKGRIGDFRGCALAAGTSTSLRCHLSSV